MNVGTRICQDEPGKGARGLTRWFASRIDWMYQLRKAIGMTNFDELNRKARERATRDYHNGRARSENPYHGSATDERQEWFDQWDNEKEMGEPDASS